MTSKRISYPVTVSFLFGFFSLVFAFQDRERVFPEFLQIYMAQKIAYGIAGLGFVFYFWKKEPDETSLTFMMVVVASYCLVNMWFVPLYEVAFLEIALASSFFRLRRQWTYPAIFGTTMIGMIATYVIQDQIEWKLPAITRADWIATIFIFFFVSWFIQKFALGVYRQQKEKSVRFELIGKEATRLIHDIKGLLSSPLLLVDSLRSGRKISTEEFEGQMLHLAQDMENVREMIKSIHRLVKLEETWVVADIQDCCKGAIKLLERRLSNVTITLPGSRLMSTSPDRLHSVFFNLLLNSIEAFEERKTSKPAIEMWWSDFTLHFKDNAGSSQERNLKEHGSGLGLEIVKADLERIGAEFEIQFEAEFTEIRLRFPRHFVAPVLDQRGTESSARIEKS